MAQKIKDKLKEMVVKKSFWLMLMGFVTSVLGLVAVYNKSATVEQVTAAWVIVQSVINYFVDKFAVDDTVKMINRALKEVRQEIVVHPKTQIYRVMKIEPTVDESAPRFFQDRD